MVIFQRAQLYIKSEVLDECKNYVGKKIERRLGIHLIPKTFWKKLRFQEIDTKKTRFQTFKRKWNKLLPRRLRPNNGVRSIQSFKLAESKIFSRGQSVANSSKLCFRFPNCSNVYCTNVQQSNSQFQNSRKFAGNCWNIQRNLWFLNRHQKRWLYTTFINWTFDAQTKVSWKTKFQARKWNPHSANPRWENCSRKKLQPPNEKNLRSNVCI